MRHPLVALSVLLALGVALAAQDVLPVEQLEQTVSQLQSRLRFKMLKQPSEEEKAALVQPEKDLADLAERIEKQKGFTERHYLVASEPFLATYPRHALRIANAGLAHFPSSRLLNEYAGNAHNGIASDLSLGAQRLAELRAAEASFRQALTCKPDTWQTHGWFFQVLHELGQCDEALRELDIVIKDPEGAKHWSSWGTPRSRAGMLLTAGKPKEAMALLQTDKPEKWGEVDHIVLVVRACALNGDVAATQAAIAKLRTAESSPRTLIEAADALAWLGKKPDALKLLAQRPPSAKFNNEEERVAQLYSQTGAAVEVFLNASDFSPGGPLRAALTKALDHHFLVADGGKQVELASSPVLMCKLLEGAAKEGEPIKDWANHMLFVLCARAAADHKAAGMEQTVIAMFAKNNDPIPGADDIPARLLAIRSNVGRPWTSGVLCGLRAIEKLQPKTPAPPSKPPAKK